eukprot:TRINITY_DN49375_c0_g1_i1.p1 TRINITY_DN49375_c0_g1~~TRINITY_DN49375_c0_g1_i1.p1  ORF type:complete len:492 (-),score=87.05 TRINITY_DN49375_c0_g1_i1:89-1510(-)
MAAASQMPKDVEARIRALPGNNTCCDCQNHTPQWASVSYGALMCLECSGHHRSLGVHLSFVRSIQMDSWSDRQIAAMEKSGGNQKLVDFFQSKGIEKNLQIHKKYNTKQAAYYRERLTRWLDGKTEPPPDPGRYDPATGGSEAQGAEPLPGETTDQYNARQARLREEARERLRQKFGNSGGMGSVGSHPQPSDDGLNLGSIASGAVGAVGGLLGKTMSFVQEKVVDNENLHGSIRGAVGSVGQLAGGVLGSIRQRAGDPDLVDSLRRNVTMQEGSSMRESVGWAANTAGGIWNKASEGFSDIGSGLGNFVDDKEGYSSAPQPPRCPKGHSLRPDPNSRAKCSMCGATGTRYTSSGDGSYNICIKCFEKPAASAAKKGGMSFDDDDWGVDDAPPPKEPTKADIDKLAKEMGMKLSNEPPAASSPVKNGSPSSEPASSPVAAAPAAAPATSPAKPKAQAKKGLQDADDFFSEFGM